MKTYRDYSHEMRTVLKLARIIRDDEARIERQYLMAIPGKIRNRAVTRIGNDWCYSGAFAEYERSHPYPVSPHKLQLEKYLLQLDYEIVRVIEVVILIGHWYTGSGESPDEIYRDYAANIERDWYEAMVSYILNRPIVPYLERGMKILKLKNSIGGN